MGQKVNPVGFRIGVTRTWDSRWFAKRDYSKLLHEDIKLREYLKGKLAGAGIGKKGAGVEQLKAEVQRLSKNEVLLNIIEVKKPEADAVLISENVASQLEK